MTLLVPRPLEVKNSNWAIENMVQVPVDTFNNPIFNYVSTLSVLFRVVIQLDRLFDKNPSRSMRSLQDDQFRIFKSVEATLAATGVDGKACLLRTICEMQQNPIGEFTIIGEILTVLLTPKRGINDFLHEYLEAERIGQSHNLTCATSYPKCPVSLFNMFKMYSTPADKPTGQLADQELEYHDEPLTAQDGVHEVEALKEVPVKQAASSEDAVHPNELRSSEDNWHPHW